MAHEIYASLVNVHPLTTALGAEIAGVDLASQLADRTITDVRRALLEWQVIFFRDQRLTPDQLRDFARRFGDLYVHPYGKSLDGYPEILPVVREPDDTGRNFGGSWHMDVTFEPEPMLGSVLYAVEVPSHGGDTLFASQSVAYETLSDGLRQTLDRLDAVHTASEAYGARTVAGARSMDLKTVAEPTEVIHPVVRVHPETKRRALFVNRLNTRRFAGWTEAESRPLLEFLFAHAERPEFQCRFRWTPGAVAFWDNRSVQHKALNDYAGQRRVMHRVSIAGDRPYGVGR
jgi:alpha-ketoglutarate-dependent taurine dioxygenase